MSRFNAVKERTKTTNYEGGEAYRESDELGLISLLVTSMLTDKFYENSGRVMNRLEEYWNNLKVTPAGREYFMKAACYTRDLFKLRSVSHLCAALVGEGVVKDLFQPEEKAMVRRFFSKVVMRPDDITEIISAYKGRLGSYVSKKGTVQLPSVMKKGLSDAMKNYDRYLLAKYRQSKKQVSMIDAVRMCHTKHTSVNNEAINELVYDKLRNETTWEAVSSKAGTDAEQTKEDVWRQFLNKEHVEYFALLRNMRNIFLNSDSEMRKKASALLTNEEHVKKSKVLPFRFLTAYEALNGVDGDGKRTITSAITKAMDIAVNNAPTLEGKTCIVVDISGSMLGSNWSVFDRITNNPISIAALFASALYKKNEESDILLFSDKVMWYTPPADDSVISLAKGIISRCGGGTYMNRAMKELSTRDYDRIILLSDQQSWAEEDEYNDVEVNKYWGKYKQEHPQTKLFSLDLAGYGTLKFPEQDVFCLAGYSDHVFNIIKNLDNDKRYFVNEVKKYLI